MPETSIELGGLTVAIAADDAVTRLARARYEAFLTSAPARWHLQILVEPEARPTIDVLRAERDGDVVTVTRSDVRGTISMTDRRATASLYAADELPLDAFIRVLFSLALIEHGGLLVHAASLVRDGRAYLFPGRSGAGKTTLARMAPDATLLSDELSLVRDGRAWGTPFWGELARGGEPMSAPLAAIYFPEQAAHHAARPLGTGDAHRRLLTTVLFFPRDPELVRSVFAIAAELAGRTPCFALSFRKDPGVWSVVNA